MAHSVSTVQFSSCSFPCVDYAHAFGNLSLTTGFAVSSQGKLDTVSVYRSRFCIDRFYSRIRSSGQAEIRIFKKGFCFGFVLMKIV